MNGRNHILVGAASWLGSSPLLITAGYVGDPRQLAAGALVASGSALLPDIDHPSATIAHTFGPFTHVLAKLVAAVSGGHRRATHSFFFAAAATAGVAAAAERWAIPTVVIVVALSVAWALDLLGPDDMLAARLTAVAVGLVGAWWVAGAIPVGPWVPAGVGVGCLAHLAADVVTKGRIPLLWPLPWRMSLSLFSTGHRVERTITPLLACAVALLAYRAFAV